MKIFRPLEKLIAMHIVLLGLIVLGLLPEEQPYNDTSTLGWALYFAIIAIALVFTIRSWIDYADYKRGQFRWRQFMSEIDNWQEELKEMKEDMEIWQNELQDIYEESEEDPFRDDNEPNQERNK